MFFPSGIASQIADCFQEADMQVRMDLSGDRIVGERDYLFRWITLLEYPDAIPGTAALKHVKKFFISNSFPGPLEQYFGCDSFFVFRYSNQVKILLIEAKYPRFHIPGYNWDGVKHGDSHFDSQLDRQRRAFVFDPLILEMFIVRNAPENSAVFYDAFGASFVEHQIAHAAIGTRRTAGWKQQDASQIINTQYTTSAFTGIRYFIREFLECRIGTTHRISTGQTELRFKLRRGRKKASELVIPVALFENQSFDFQQNAVQLMKDFGFRQFGFIEFEQG